MDVGGVSVDMGVVSIDMGVVYRCERCLCGRGSVSVDVEGLLSGCWRSRENSISETDLDLWMSPQLQAEEWKQTY